MPDAYESPKSGSSDTLLDVEANDTLKEERLAAILLRVLGVYFLAWAIVYGIEALVRILMVLRKSDLDSVLSEQWMHLTYVVCTFAVGAYLLFGGRWVFEKVLMPVVPQLLADNEADAEQEAFDKPTGMDDSPSMRTG